jgi:hypothetical protein
MVGASCIAHGIREAVRDPYSAASKDPRGTHPFLVSSEFAESLVYQSNFPAYRPAASVDAFSGVSSVSVIAEITAGARILTVDAEPGLIRWLPRSEVGDTEES